MATTFLPRLAVTPGEPAGIGMELLVRLAHVPDLAADLVLVGDADHARRTADALGLPLQLDEFDPARRLDGEPRPGVVRCLHRPLPRPPRPGVLDPDNAAGVLDTLAQACDGCLAGRFEALLTLPVHKGVINAGGVAFTGHTEYLAGRCDSPVLMLLVSGTLRVALATTHLPLRAVPDAIDGAGLAATLALLDGGLRRDFGLTAPRIAVLGLNPHAGEDGHLGREEIEVIAPVLADLRGRGLALAGPLAADTAFVAGRREQHDAFLAMYHDQGLPVLKALGFGAAVNVSLGLPVVRTSVDHGVALDIAGSGRADPGSAIAAARLALGIAANRAARR
ncbi:MAG: 4-hydroxythreonine-4-phosphate dehydrogenase PdxA [Xanthomonadales bacterium]|nr:4-hydroxythreonine-4-phosphate dehydrogenase PdxA [Xanthomonadales bacterium]